MLGNATLLGLGPGLRTGFGAGFGSKPSSGVNRVNPYRTIGSTGLGLGFTGFCGWVRGYASLEGAYLNPVDPNLGTCGVLVRPASIRTSQNPRVPFPNPRYGIPRGNGPCPLQLIAGANDDHR